jgi:hypothetical protein
VKTMIKIDYEKLKKAVDMLYEAVDYSGVHYVEFETECRNKITKIRGGGDIIEVPVEYLPVLALKLLFEYERVKTEFETWAKKFQEGRWE